MHRNALYNGLELVCIITLFSITNIEPTIIEKKMTADETQ